MQKSMFLNKKLDTAHHLLKLNWCHQRGCYGSEKHQTFEFSLLLDFLCIFKNHQFCDFLENS